LPKDRIKRELVYCNKRVEVIGTGDAIPAQAV
jgi:hypothetical protein